MDNGCDPSRIRVNETLIDARLATVTAIEAGSEDAEGRRILSRSIL